MNFNQVQLKWIAILSKTFLIFPPKNLILNKMVLVNRNSLNLLDLVGNDIESMSLKRLSPKNT